MDDPSIHDEDGLLRRVPNWPTMMVLDENRNVLRPSSACFSDGETHDEEISVTLEKSLLESGGRHETAITNFPDFGLARLKAGLVRNELASPQVIRRDATDADPHHALIIGKKTKADKRKMALNSTLVIKPQNF